MAITPKVNQAADAISAARENPVVQKILSDEQLHDNARAAVDAARSLFDQMQSKAPASAKLTNDKLYDELQTLATSLRDATDSLRGASAPRKARLGFGKVVGLGVAGGVAALALSENLRGKVLDALFGAEEEFTYTPSSAVNGSAPAAKPAAAAAANGNGAGSKEAAASATKAAAKPAAAAKPKTTKAKPKAEAEETKADDAGDTDA